MIYSIAILGKRNEPLYFDCSEEPAEALNLQAVTYSCLDVIDERKKKLVIAFVEKYFFFFLLLLLF